MLDIKLVLVDIDGTLLNDHGVIGKKTIEAIAKLKDHHILFGIATGRTPYSVRHLIKDWGIAEYVDVIMGFNGGCYLDMKTHQMKSCYLLDGIYLPEIFDDFKQFTFNAGIYDKESFHVLKEDDRVKNIASRNKLPLIIDDLSQYFNSQVEKMLFIAEDEEINKMNVYYQTLKNKGYKAVKSTPILLEFLNPELSKSKGIMQLCQNYHINANQVLTFGDELNDYEMIKDFQGVAMANANPLIKEIATYVTLSNNEDGIAYFLNKYILK